MLFVDADCPELGDECWVKCVLTLRLKISMLEDSRITVRQTATADCLKPRVARTASATLTVNKMSLKRIGECGLVDSRTVVHVNKLVCRPVDLILYERVASLKVMRFSIGSQCINSSRIGVIRSYLPCRRVTRAKVFWTRCSLIKSDFDVPGYTSEQRRTLVEPWAHDAAGDSSSNIARQWCTNMTQRSHVCHKLVKRQFRVEFHAKTLRPVKAWSWWQYLRPEVMWCPRIDYVHGYSSEPCKHEDTVVWKARHRKILLSSEIKKFKMLQSVYTRVVS